MGLSAVKPKGILRYNQYDQAIRAALEGQGIALGRIALIEPLLAQGRLIAVGGADLDQAHGYAYWLVQADATPRDDVEVVVEWIRAEAKSVELRLEDELSALAEVEFRRRDALDGAGASLTLARFERNAFSRPADRRPQGGRKSWAAPFTPSVACGLVRQ